MPSQMLPSCGHFLRGDSTQPPLAMPPITTSYPYATHMHPYLLPTPNPNPAFYPYHPYPTLPPESISICFACELRVHDPIFFIPYCTVMMPRCQHKQICCFCLTRTVLQLLYINWPILPPLSVFLFNFKTFHHKAVSIHYRIL